MTAVRALLLVVAAAGSVAACSSSSSGKSTPAASTSAAATSASVPSAPATSAAPATSPASTTGGCDTGPVTPLCDTFAFTGAVPVTGTVEQSALGNNGVAKSCADVVAGNSNGASNRSFEVPRGNTLKKVGGHLVMIDAVVKFGHYHGAGTYGVIDIDTSGGLFIDDVTYKAVPTTTASITVRADGGGSLVFTNLARSDGKTESGSMSWTCEFGS